eukprot:5606462-Prymnesium_polylepis.1
MPASAAPEERARSEEGPRRHVRQTMIVELIPRPDASLRLVCFPWAGGTAHSYLEWRDHFPAETIELLAVALPGRGARVAEPAYTDLPALVNDVVEALLPYLSAPFAFFGHSFGAILATEVARALELRALPAPLSLLLSAHPAPGLALPAEQAELSAANDGALLEGLKRWDFAADSVIADAADPSLSALVLGSIRADLALREAYCAEACASL